MNAKVDVIALTSLAAEVMQYNPYINKVLLKPNEEEIIAIANDYDLALNIHVTPQGERYFKLLNRDAINFSRTNQQHVAESFLQFAAKTFDFDLVNFDASYSLYPQQEHMQNIEKMLKRGGVNFTDDVLIGFHLGCHGLAKKRTRFWKRHSHPKAWPFKSFVKLAKKLQKHNPHIKIVLTGSKSEEKLGQLFGKKINNTINLIGQTSVLDLAALMSYLKLFLTNDTGVMHIACATNIKLIALFGHTDPIVTGPYPKKDYRVVLFNKNMKKIKVDNVFQNIISML